MVLGTLQTHRTQIRHRIDGGTLEYAQARRHDVHMIKHFVHGGGRLMNRAHNCATLA